MQHQNEYSFMASLHSLQEANHTAKFYIMNTSRNRNRWGVSTQALSDALPTLKGVKIGMGTGYRIDQHYPEGETMDSGAFIDYEFPGTYAIGTAKIDDPHTWGMMKNSELGPISVVIQCFRDVCSECGANLIGTKDPFGTHKCLKDGDAYSQVESFRFKRVDFVDVPAYPQAGLMEMSAKNTSGTVPLELCASFYNSQSSDNLEKAIIEMRSQMGFPNAEIFTADMNRAVKEMRSKLGFDHTLSEDMQAAIKEARARMGLPE